MSASIPVKQSTSIDNATVAEFLRANPDFFAAHPDVLAELSLPHQSGEAISLVERQVAVLRERNIEMRNRLGRLVDNARENDRLFELTRRLVLELLLADSLPAAAEALNKSLSNDFKTDFNQLCLLQSEPRCDKYFHSVTPVDARASIGNLLDARQVICGVLRRSENEFLFGDASDQVRSAAVVPIGQASKIGLLAVGSKDPQHYKSGMGTLFLSYIGEILAHALPKYL